MIGRSTLSTRPITSTPHAARPIAGQIEPVDSRYTATGPHTSAAPTAGSSDNSAITAPHRSAPLMPSTQNARPPSVPCTSATTTFPFTVARTTGELGQQPRGLALLQRHGPRGLRRQALAIAQQEEQQVQ